MTRKKLDNQTHNDFQVSHVIANAVVFKNLWGKKLQEETFCIYLKSQSTLCILLL